MAIQKEEDLKKDLHMGREDVRGCLSLKTTTNQKEKARENRT